MKLQFKRLLLNLRSRLKIQKRKLFLFIVFFLVLDVGLFLVEKGLEKKVAGSWSSPVILGERGLILEQEENRPLFKKQDKLSGNYSLEVVCDINLQKKNVESTFFEIVFCSGYSWVLSFQEFDRVGIYTRGQGRPKRFVSSNGYEGFEHRGRKLRDFALRFDCDLDKGQVDVFVNKEFYETVVFDSKEVGFCNIFIYKFIGERTGHIVLRSFKVFKENNEIVLAKSYILLSHLKNYLGLFRRIIRLFLLLTCGLVMFFLLSGRSLFFYVVTVIVVLLGTEIYLRINQRSNPFFNVDVLMGNPRWHIERFTNLLGQYDDKSSIFCGNRGGLYSVEKKENCKRILCVGTSSTEGVMVKSLRDVYPNVLEDLINREKNIKCEVINSGIGGYESFRLSVYLKEVLLKLNPDIVVVYLGGNDSWMPTEDIFMAYQRMKILRKQHSDWIKTARRLFMALEFRFPVRVIVTAYDFLCESYLFMGVNSLRKDLFNSIYRLRYKNFDYWKERKNISQDSLAAMVSMCKDKGIKVLLIPEMSQRGSFCFDEYAEAMEKLSNQNQGVYFLDLRDAFLKPHKEMLFYDYVHPTEYGHKLIAEEIYRKLLKQNLI